MVKCVLEEQHQQLGDRNFEIEQLKMKIVISQEQEESDQEEHEGELKDFARPSNLTISRD